MAGSATIRGQATASGSGQANVTTGAFTPTAGKPLLAVCMWFGGTNQTGTFSDTTGANDGFSATGIPEVYDAGSSTQMAAAILTGTLATSTTVRFTPTSGTMEYPTIVVIELDGVDLTGGVLAALAVYQANASHFAADTITSGALGSLSDQRCLIGVCWEADGVPAGIPTAGTGATSVGTMGDYGSGATGRVQIRTGVTGTSNDAVTLTNASGAFRHYATLAVALKEVVTDTTLTPTAGRLTMAGKAPTLSQTQGQTLAPLRGRLTMAGKQPALSQTQAQTLAPSAGRLTISGKQPSITKSIVLAPTAGRLTMAGKQPALGNRQILVTWDDVSGEDGYRVKWGPATNTYTSQADVSANVTSYTISGQVLMQNLFVRVYALVGGVEQDPSDEIRLTVGLGFMPTAGRLTMAGKQPSIVQSRALTPVAGRLTMVGKQPSVVRSLVYTPVAGRATITGKQPVIVQAIVKEPVRGRLTITGKQPSITQPRSLTPSAGRLNVAGNRPAVMQEVPAEDVGGVGMLDAISAAAYREAGTAAQKAEAVRDSLGGGTLTVELRDDGTLVYTGTFSGPMVASGGRLTASALLDGLASEDGTPNAALWTCRIRNASGRYIQGSFGPGGRFTFSSAGFVYGQTMRINIAINPDPAIAPEPEPPPPGPSSDLLAVDQAAIAAITLVRGGAAFNLATYTSGGVPPYTFVIEEGSLPTGVTQSSSGGHTGNLLTAAGDAAQQAFPSPIELDHDTRDVSNGLRMIVIDSSE